MVIEKKNKKRENLRAEKSYRRVTKKKKDEGEKKMLHGNVNCLG